MKNDKSLNIICKRLTDWNICCRKVLNLPPSTRTYLIHNIKDTLPIRNIIMNRILNFFTSGVNHNCALISDFFKNVLLSNSSHMSTNVNTILQFLNVNYSDLFNLNKGQIRQLFENKTDEPDWRCNFMKELLFIRENQHSIDLNENEIKMILEYLATYRE